MATPTDGIDINPTQAGDTTFARQPSTSAATNTGNASRDYIRNLLSRYGLQGLTDTVMGFFVESMNEAQIMQRLRDTEEFQARFPAIAAREAAGLSAVSPEEILSYEQTVRDIFNRAGFPTTFYDTTAEIQDLLSNDISPTELQDRVQAGFAEVERNPDVLEAFNQLFGTQGLSEVAMWVLDPDRSVPAIERARNAARFKGFADSVGFNVDRGFALGRTGQAAGALSDQALRDRLEAAAEQAPVLGETIGDRARGSQLGGADNMGAVFQTDPQAARDIRRRQQGRANFERGGGGLTESRRGIVGAG